MKKKWFRNFIRGLSLTSALFVFQACYGTLQDYALDLFIEGQVKSKTSGLPIEGIKVSVTSTSQFELTDEEGKFALYVHTLDGLTVRFQDIDAELNGLFANKDTTLTEVTDRVYLDILMEER
jgi:hypothetical protein